MRPGFWRRRDLHQDAKLLLPAHLLQPSGAARGRGRHRAGARRQGIFLEGVRRLLRAVRRARPGVHHLSVQRSVPQRRRLGLRPQPRRVRRISVEVKSDSLVGTEQTEEDFNTFSARPVRWNFKFLGWRNLLCVMVEVRLPALLRPQRFRARRRMDDAPVRGGRAHAQGRASSL